MFRTEDYTPMGGPQITPKYVGRRGVPTYGDMAEGAPEEADALISLIRMPAHTNERTATAASMAKTKNTISRLSLGIPILLPHRGPLPATVFLDCHCLLLRCERSLGLTLGIGEKGASIRSKIAGSSFS